MKKILSLTLALTLILHSCAPSPFSHSTSSWRTHPTDDNSLLSPGYKGLSYASTDDYFITLRVYDVRRAYEQYGMMYVNKSDEWVQVDPRHFSMRIPETNRIKRALTQSDMDRLHSVESSNDGARAFFWTAVLGGGLIWLITAGDGDPTAIQSGNIGMPKPQTVRGSMREMLAPTSIAPGDTLYGSIYFESDDPGFRRVGYQPGGDIEGAEFSFERL